MCSRQRKAAKCESADVSFASDPTRPSIGVKGLAVQILGVRCSPPSKRVRGFRARTHDIHTADGQNPA